MNRAPAQDGTRATQAHGVSDAHIEYAETGAGPTVVLVPGSLSTGAAWKPIVASLENRFRIVTTSLLGNGATDERRSMANASIEPQVDALEWVVRRAAAGGRPVHVVSHSYGGVGVLAMTLRGAMPIASLVLIEANPADVLRQAGEQALYTCFRTMSDAYTEAFAAGEPDAVARVIDFYSGAGSFASFPARVREYLVERTLSNVIDWKSMYGFDAPLAAYARIAVPTLIVRGTQGHAAMNRIGELLHQRIPGASLVSIDDAGHFLLATHAARLARLIADHVTGVEASVA